MRKLWLVGLAVAFFLSLISRPSFIKGNEIEQVESKEIDSYELFWPLVAGKTRGDSTYSLKRLKEKIRGWLIFNDSKKVDYALFLSTKRVIEAEQLLKENREGDALKTLEEMSKELDFTLARWEKFKQSGKDSPEKMNIANQLNNFQKFLPHLANKYSEPVRIQSLQLLKKVNSF